MFNLHFDHLFKKLFRGAKGKGFKDRILANRQMNAMQLLKKSAKESFIIQSISLVDT